VVTDNARVAPINADPTYFSTELSPDFDAFAQQHFVVDQPGWTELKLGTTARGRRPGRSSGSAVA
jgi:hypothetical protein